MHTLAKLGFPLLLTMLAATQIGCAGTTKTAKSAAEASGDEAPDHAEVGKPAPDLSIHTLNGKGDISLASLSGKVVVVDFWATWCGPCKQSFPKLEELQKKMGTDAVVVGVAVDDEDSGILDFAKENGATFPIGWDEGHAIANRWKVGTMPTTFIVDGAGVVRYVHAGYHDGETEHMAKEIAEIASDPSTRVAKRSKPKREDAEASSSVDAKSDGSSKPDPQPSVAAAAPAAEEEADKEPPPPPKKKKATKKAGGRKSGKKTSKRKA